MKKLVTEKSKMIFNETKEYLVDGVASSFHRGEDEEYPLCMEKGKGSKVYDVDGNEYIDYVAAFGPMILGYCPESVNLAVIKQLEKGSHLAATTQDLLKLSKKLTEIIPSAEKVSYQSSGTEANMHALRVARAFTSKIKIIKFEGQYHGWTDEVKVSIDADFLHEMGPRHTPKRIYHSKGQRNETSDDLIIIPWNDLKALENTIIKHHNEIAAIITEPIMFDSGPIMPAPGYLEGMRELATKYNIVLIFDEVITGFRAALGGAQEYLKITPDVSVFAKAITAGFPLSAIVGKKEIMDSGVHSSGTFNANPVSVAAALATIAALEQKGVYEKFDTIGQLFTDGIYKLAEKYNKTLYCKFIGAIGILIFGVSEAPEDFRHFVDKADVKYYTYFVRRAKEYGVRFTSKRGRIYISTEHSEEDIIRTLQVIEQIFSEA